jgi:hypothetical protein
MPDAEFGLRHRQLGLVAASAVSVVAVVAVVALVVHPWRDTAARSPAAGATGPATSSDSGLASPATSLPAVSVREPAFSAAPAASPTATNGPPTPSSTTSPVGRRASPTARSVAEDSQPNFKVNVQVSPTHVVWGHPVRVTVTVVDAGGVFDRPVVMFVQGSDPSDTVSDAMPPCTATYGSITCPITDVRPGHTWSFTFTFIPGRFPGTDGFDDPVAAAFNYTDSHGQQQESPLYYAHVMLFDPPASSPPPASGAPSNTPPPSVPPASAASTSATSAA